MIAIIDTCFKPGNIIRKSVAFTTFVISLSFYGSAQDGSFNNLTTNTLTLAGGFNNHSGWGVNTANLVDQRPNALDRPVFVMNNHFGLTFSAHSYYGGIRFYNQGYPGYPLDGAGASGAKLVMSLTDGMVGVGTTTPQYPLDVIGKIRASHSINTDQGTNNYGNVHWGLNTNNTLRFGVGLFNSEAGNTQGADFSIWRYGDDGNYIANAFFIKRDNGNVGVGTASPQAKLHVEGSTYIKTDDDDVLTFDNADNSWQYMQFNGNGVRKTWMGIDPSNNFNIYKENGGAILFGGGNVGIGTSNPGSYRLAVEGTIGARKVKVTQVSWADYVFEKNYHLPSIAEVEKYIQQHKHLPDVPSAKEVEENGLDLGDNQALLLKKIEEQMLYIIDLNKEVQALKKENAELKNISEKVKKIEELLSKTNPDEN